MEQVEKLWSHQAETLAFLKERGFDNSDPGTGKTRAQLELYASRKARGRMLVLCTKTLMEAAWGADIKKYTPHLSYSLARAENREEAFKTRTDIVVMNIDGVKWLAKKENKKYLYAFDHLVIDEYTFFKHASSQRSKALASIRGQFRFRFGLSGTPNPNSVMELWHPALIIDDGKRLGTSYFKLRANVQIPTQIGPSANHLRWDDKPGVADAVSELLGDITIRHEFDKVMTHVPPNHKHFKDFSLAPRAKKVYDQMENDLIVMLEQGEVAAVHAASLRTKLLQIASGAVYDNHEDAENDTASYQIIDRQRYELIADLIEERKHSVTFFNWKHQRDELCKELDARDIRFVVIDGKTSDAKRGQIVEEFQAGKYQSILLHPRTGAHGLTLTAADTTILASPIYEADLLAQAIKRIHRGTQDKVTNTIMIRAKGTVEDLVYNRLFEKAGRMEDLLSLMAARKKR